MEEFDVTRVNNMSTEIIGSSIGGYIKKATIDNISKKTAQFTIRNNANGKSHFDIIVGNEFNSLDFFSTRISTFKEFLELNQDEYLGVGEERSIIPYIEQRIGKKVYYQDKRGKKWYWVNVCKGKAHSIKDFSFVLVIDSPRNLRGEELSLWAFLNKSGGRQWVLK